MDTWSSPTVSWEFGARSEVDSQSRLAPRFPYQYLVHG